MSHLRYIGLMLSLAFSPFANGAGNPVVTSLIGKHQARLSTEIRQCR